MVQQSAEPGMDGSSSRCVHPGKVRRQGNPALRPDPGLLAWDPSGLAPSLGRSRVLRPRHQYYEPVRLPTSARKRTPAVPCAPPPPETNPADPVGPLMFQRMLSMHDPAFDPGGAIAVSRSDGVRAAFAAMEPARPPRTSTFRGSIPHPA
jgi:hypothetical protein